MQIDTGTYGAKRQSYLPSSPRAILLAVVERYPHEDKQKLFQIFFEQLMEADDKNLIEAIAQYWFAGEYKNLTKSSPRASAPAPTAAAPPPTSELKARLQEHIDRRVQIVLSELLMPSGTRLRDSNKDECQRVGGWMTTLANGMEDGQLVGEVFGEDQLRKIYLGE